MPGPPPKLDAERRRRNERPIATRTVDISDLASRPIEIPVAREEWHPIAIDWFESLAQSGQAMFYEPSDWMTAYFIAEEMSRELMPKPMQITDKETGEMYVEFYSAPMQGAKLNSIIGALKTLMATEAERRRLAIEILRKRGSEATDDEGDDTTSERHLALVDSA